METKDRVFPLNSLRVFEAAARHLHLTKAADELCVTYSAVSHQIRSLERNLGVSLFDRSQKPMHLTPAGVRLSQALAESLSDINRVTRELSNTQISSKLNVSCAPSLALKWLVPSLKPFLDKYPGIQIQLYPETQMRNRNADIDLAIGYGEPQEIPGWRIVCTAHVDLTPVASRTLSGKVHSIQSPVDLLGYTLLHEDDGAIWTRWLSVSGVQLSGKLPGLYLGRAHLALAGAVEGYGVAIIDPILGEKDIEAGTLVRLFAQTVPMPHPYYLIAPEKRKMSFPAQEMEALICTAFRKWGGLKQLT
jgi:LysR family glycine cleavage system transcriptional activator